jgi:hypothetical protein
LPFPPHFLIFAGQPWYQVQTDVCEVRGGLVGQQETCAIKASQVALQDAIDTTDVIGRWDWDIPNDRLYADATVALLFNVDPALAEVGTSFSRFLSGMHFEDREQTRRLVARCAKEGRSYLTEYRVCSADGNMRWVLARGRFILDQTGAPLSGSGILIDVTRLRVEEVERAPEAVLHSSHPLDRAAEHCLAAHKAINELPRSELHQMSATLLLEVGRKLAKLEGDQRRARMN